MTYREHMRQSEIAYLREILEKTGGNVRAAAALVEMPERTLWRKMAVLGLTRQKTLTKMSHQEKLSKSAL